MIYKNRLYSMSLVIIGSLFLAGCWPFGADRQEKESSKPELMVINVLDIADYEDCHIKGSVHIDFDAFESQAKTMNKKNYYVVYCADYMCMSSSFCTKILQEAGFEHVWAYEGGMAEWYQKGYPYEGVAEMDYLKSENVNLAADEPSEVPTLTADDLLEMMKEFNIGQ